MKVRAFAALAFGLLAAPLLAQQLSLETILVRNRPAEDLVPVIQPLVGPDGSVAAFGSRLIVKAQPRALREIKELVEKLDVVPRSLWITVRQSRDAETSGRTVGGNVTVERRDGQRGETRTTTRVTGAFGQGSSSEQGQDVQQLRALEGHASFIRLGKEVPVPQAIVVPGPAGPEVARGSVYAEAESGFYVTARLAGDFVTLEITTLGDRIDDAGRIDRQQLRSSVSGRLGEWISLGGLERSESTSERGTLSRSSSRALDLRSVRLKVDEVR
jgi:hypothetical protein